MNQEACWMHEEDEETDGEVRSLRSTDTGVPVTPESPAPTSADPGANRRPPGHHSGDRPET